MGLRERDKIGDAVGPGAAIDKATRPSRQEWEDAGKSDARHAPARVKAQARIAAAVAASESLREVLDEEPTPADRRALVEAAKQIEARPAREAALHWARSAPKRPGGPEELYWPPRLAEVKHPERLGDTSLIDGSPRKPHADPREADRFLAMINAPGWDPPDFGDDELNANAAAFAERPYLIPDP